MLIFMSKIPELRKTLDIFDDSDLDAFCQDNFIEVYNKFSRGLRKDEKVSLLLDYCRRKGEIDILTNLLLSSQEQGAIKNIDMTDSIKTSDSKVKVFLNHSSDDKPLIRKLHKTLKNVPWIDPWLDEEKLLPGQDWQHEIDKAIKDSDAVLICMSKKSITKIGVVQSEIRRAEELQKLRPQGYIFMIPVLLEKCVVPENLSQYQWVDITESENIKRIIRSLENLRK
jgi:hypothetical protein